MITLHRIYTWAIFPVIATIYIAMQILQLIFNILNNLTYTIFFIDIPAPTEMPDMVPPHDHAKAIYLYRLMVAILDAFATFWAALKSLNTYKF